MEKTLKMSFVCAYCRKSLGSDEECDCRTELPQPTKADRDLGIGLKSYTGVVRKITIEEYDATTEAYTEEEFRRYVKDQDWHVTKKVTKTIVEIKIGAVVCAEKE